MKRLTTATFVVLVAVHGAGCTNVLYNGPPRDKHAVSLIISGTRTTMVSIDGDAVEDGAFTRFEVAPGVHSVEIDLSQNGGSKELQRRLRTTCFEAKRSHLYEIRTEAIGRRTRATVLDADTNQTVGKPCPEAPPIAQAAPQPAAQQGAQESTTTMPGEEIDENDGTHHRSTRAPSPPKVGLRLGLGLAEGGETVSEVRYSSGDSEALHLGDGLTITAALAFTPYWIDDSIGLGLGVSGGLKYGWLDTEGYSASISRTSLAGWFQFAFRPTNQWFAYLDLGAQKDFGISASDSGGDKSASYSLTSHWGFMSEGGLYRLLSRNFGCGVDLRFVKIDYAIGSQVFTADSFGGEFMINVLF